MENTQPKVTAAQCENGVLALTLSGGAVEGVTVTAPVAGIAPLAKLGADQLAQVEVVGNGHILAWREANVDFAVSGLLEKLVGIQSQRSHLAKAARISTEAKAEAARANGAKGGRPRKQPSLV